MGSMRQWLKDKDAEGKGRVAVVHCKAGKGRSGTVSCSYLISEEGWTPEDAKQRFTERRMRPGFGAGISIPSQQRWIGYVDRWTKGGKTYVDRPIEITEIHVWGLRNGVKLSIEGFEDEGKVIKCFHTFQKTERHVIRGGIKKDHGFADVALEAMGKKKSGTDTAQQIKEASKAQKNADEASPDTPTSATSLDDELPTGGDVIFRPSKPVVVPTSDVNIDFERRNKSKYGGFTMVTSVAHVWFNAYFEGNGPESASHEANDSGVFAIEFDAMDGIKGSSRKGTRAFDKMSVVWKAMPPTRKKPSIVVSEPGEGEEVKQARAADWRGADGKSEDAEKKLGLRTADQASAEVSRASSMKSNRGGGDSPIKDEMEGVQSTGPDGKALDQKKEETSPLKTTESATSNDQK